MHPLEQAADAWIHGADLNQPKVGDADVRSTVPTDAHTQTQPTPAELGPNWNYGLKYCLRISCGYVLVHKIISGKAVVVNDEVSSNLFYLSAQLLVRWQFGPIRGPRLHLAEIQGV